MSSSFLSLPPTRLQCANVLKPLKKACKSQLRTANILTTINAAFATCPALSGTPGHYILCGAVSRSQTAHRPRRVEVCVPIENDLVAAVDRA